MNSLSPCAFLGVGVLCTFLPNERLISLVIPDVVIEPLAYEKVTVQDVSVLSVLTKNRKLGRVASAVFPLLLALFEVSYEAPPACKTACAFSNVGADSHESSNR